MNASTLHTIQTNRVTVEFNLVKKFEFNWRKFIPSQEQFLHWALDFAFVLFFAFCVAYALVFPFTRMMRGEHLWGAAALVILAQQLLSIFHRAHQGKVKLWLVPVKLFDSKFRQQYCPPGILGILMVTACMFIPAGQFVLVKGSAYMSYYRPLISIVLFFAIWGMTADLKYAPHPLHSLRDVLAFLGNVAINIVAGIFLIGRSVGKAVSGRMPENVVQQKTAKADAKRPQIVPSEVMDHEVALNHAMSGVRASVDTIAAALRIQKKRDQDWLEASLNKLRFPVHVIEKLMTELEGSSKDYPVLAEQLRREDFKSKSARFLLVLDGKEI